MVDTKVSTIKSRRVAISLSCDASKQSRPSRHRACSCKRLLQSTENPNMQKHKNLKMEHLCCENGHKTMSFSRTYAMKTCYTRRNQLSDLAVHYHADGGRRYPIVAGHKLVFRKGKKKKKKKKHSKNRKISKFGLKVHPETKNRLR